MRFGPILVTYFLIGACMWGGGVLAWEDSGVGAFFIDDPTAVSSDDAVNEETTTLLGRLGGPITQVAGSTLGGGLVATWNVLVRLIGYLFWPTTALLSVGAPPRAVVLGTTLSVAFLASILRIVRGSA